MEREVDDEAFREARRQQKANIERECKAAVDKYIAEQELKRKEAEEVSELAKKAVDKALQD